MSLRPRRPSVSIYDYPEHLNPFHEDTTSLEVKHESTTSLEVKRKDKSSKESRQKFWTFGRSRKVRSNSFSIKSTWNGLFGKRKEATEPIEKKSTITTVSTTYRREPYDRSTAPSRLSKDQQEFDEALGTLARRRKYTLDSNVTRCNSSLTVNGDPARIYDGNPQDTTASIMGDLTPKPPARRFGQVSPRPTDKIPPLNFEDKQPNQNGNVNLTCDDKTEGTPVPPLRRFSNRSSQRLNAGTPDFEEEANRSGDVTLRDENENVPEDYVFKRFSQDAVRRSNVSINSCVSITSASGRKKRRAPQPPKRKEQLESPLENDGRSTTETTKVELQITEPIDIVRVTENIDELTKKGCELNEEAEKTNESVLREREKQSELSSENTGDTSPDHVARKNETCVVSKDNAVKEEVDTMKEEEDSKEKLAQSTDDTSEQKPESETIVESETVAEEDSTKKVDPVDVEYRRTSQEKIEILKDVDQEEVCLRRGDSASTLSRSDSFSVKEEIEKIERQIKALESKNATVEQENIDDNRVQHRDDAITSPRFSIQANRRHFFENMVTNGGRSGVKIEFKELPREQKDIHVVRLTDAPVPIATPREPVKVIELHISEPIKCRPELLDEVNPIPKPRRHSALSLKDVQAESRLTRNESPEDGDKRGKSF